MLRFITAQSFRACLPIPRPLSLTTTMPSPLPACSRWMAMSRAPALRAVAASALSTSSARA